MHAASAAPPAERRAGIPRRLAAPQPDAPGTELGWIAGQEVGEAARRFRLEAPLAMGGMAQVWRATDLAASSWLGAPVAVAVKLVSAASAAGAARARQLVREALCLRTLGHPHIVRVFDWGEDTATDSVFLVMELLDGEDGERRLQRAGPLPAQAACAVLADVGAALDHAWHSRRLVHRDLKPANLWFMTDGGLKLLDFGLGCGAPPSAGTPGYRAPEPVAAPDRRADVFGAASLFCRLTGGRLALPAGLPPAALDLLRCARAADPASRPASVSALAAQLQAALAPPPAAAPGWQPPVVVAQRGPGPDEQAAHAARRARWRAQLAARRAASLQAVAHEPERTVPAASPVGDGVLGALTQRTAEPPAGADARPPVRVPVWRDAFRAGDGEGPLLVSLPAGWFQMGSTEAERAAARAAGARPAWLAREAPRHPVHIVRPFALGQGPVTVAAWRRFAHETGLGQEGGMHWRAPGFFQSEGDPVVGVTWDAAVRYTRWLSVRTGQRYRLPTEAEWEYACRADAPGADASDALLAPAQAHCDHRLAGQAAPGRWRTGTCPVGRHPANAWGLLDMHGNVWEWVQDAFHADYAGAPDDGSAWEEGGDPARRILRGGSWASHPRELRAAVRNALAARLAHAQVGFRVVREV